ncbi:hypothetical protein GCM10010483_06040 [Actinokineospora diospyrosa]
MDKVSYFDAWARWFDVDDSLKHAYMWGMKIAWWGRLGKVLAFVSGAFVVFDLIRGETIKEKMSESWVKDERREIHAHLISP